MFYPFVTLTLRGRMSSFEKSTDDPKWIENFNLAIRQAKQQEYKSSLLSLNMALVDAPRDRLGDCYGLRAYIQLKEREYKKAEQDASTAITFDPQNSEFLVWRATARLMQKAYKDSVIDLQKAIKLNPSLRLNEDALIDYVANVVREETHSKALASGLSDNDWYIRGLAYQLKDDNTNALRDVQMAIQTRELPEYFFLRAEIFLDTGKLKKCIEDCTHLIDTDKVHRASALRIRAAAYSRSGDKSNAFRDLDRVKSLLPNDFDNLVECGVLRFEQSDYLGSIKEFTEALKIAPQSDLVLMLRGKSHLMMKNNVAATDDLSRSIAIAPNNLQALVERGRCHINRRDFEAARNDFNSALKIDRTSLQSQLGLSRTFFESQKWDKSKEVAEKVLRIDPQNSEARLILGGIEYERKQYDESIEQFSKAIDVVESEELKVEAFYRRGISYVDGDKLKRGIRDFSKVLELNQQHAGALIWRANAHAKMGSLVATLKDLHSAIDFNPEAPDQYRKFGEVVANKGLAHFKTLDESERTSFGNLQLHAYSLSMLGRHSEAVIAFNKCLNHESGDNDPTLLLRKSQMQSQLEMYEESIECLENAAKEESSIQWFIFQTLAETHLANDDRKQAIIELGNAIRLAQNNETLFLKRGQIHVMRGKGERAIDDFSQAIAIRPDRYKAYRERGNLLAALGKLDSSIEDINVSVDLFAKQPDLIQKRGELHLRLRHWEAAREDFELAVTHDPLLVRSYCGRALAMIQTHEHESALIWLTKALHRFSKTEDWVEILSTRARVFHGMGRFSRAIADYTTLIELLDEDKSAPSYYARGIAYLHLDDKKKAKRDWLKSLSINEDQKPVNAAMDWLKKPHAKQPADLKPPISVKPTRPKVVRDPIKVLRDEGEWDAKAPFDLWVLKSDEGTEFGPIPKEVLEGWVQEGRINGDFKLLRADWDRWKNASKIFSELSSPRKKSSNSESKKQPKKRNIDSTTEFDSMDDQ